MFAQYPYLNINDFNLDYILKAIKDMRYEVTNFVSINAIKYANPIQWDITRQYEKNTIVIDPVTGTAYISVAPVPVGVALTRPEYWTVVFDLQSFVTKANQNLANNYESQTTTTATMNTAAGEWVIWGDVLYKALVNITAGDAYVVGSNIQRIVIEDVIKAIMQDIADEVQARQDADDAINNAVGDLDNLTTTDKSNLVAAINEVNSTGGGAIAMIGDLNDLSTTDKDNVVDAINEIYDDVTAISQAFGYVMPEEYGAVGDGVSDDTSAVQSAINNGITNNKIVLLRKIYKVHTLNITGDIIVMGGELSAFTGAATNTENIITSNGNYNITFVDTKFNGNAVSHAVGTYDLVNMIRITGANKVSFLGCEICNHGQTDGNPDETAWYLRRIDAINCINCAQVVFDRCYIHSNHTEQIAIGSRYAITKCIITNCKSDDNMDAYALFLLFNLKCGVVANNTFTDNGTTFINMLSNNLIISNNIFDTSGRRGISSENQGAAMRLTNIMIDHNYIRAAAGGGIDCGINDCHVINNTIEECANYAILMAGQYSGDASDVIETDELPWKDNTLHDNANISIKGNHIINHKNTGNAKPAAIAIKAEYNTTNGITTYGNIKRVQIADNVIDLNNTEIYPNGVMFFTYNNIDDINISDNIITNYSNSAIYLSYSSAAICGSLNNIKITDNVFDSLPIAINYVIINPVCTKISNIMVANNVLAKPCRQALFVSAPNGSIYGVCDVSNNLVKGTPERLLATTSYKTKALCGTVKSFAVDDLANLPDGLSVNVGDEVRVITPVTGLYNKFCTARGTCGTLSGCTASTTNGSYTITVNDGTLLNVGDIIAIAGVGGTFIVQTINGNTVTLEYPVAATVSGAAVSYRAPSFKDGLTLT